MAKLAVIADDFTGALDTAVQFAKLGIQTLVTTGSTLPSQGMPREAEVWVFDLETRHLAPKQAAELVGMCTAALGSAGVKYFYKKTDSAMRGNIGSELGAMCASGGGDTLFFIPAFPKAERITVSGIHYCAGVPVSRTAFGKDPFNPVREDYIPDIIARQTTVGTELVSQDKLHLLTEASARGGKILVFDAASDGEMRSIADNLKRIGTPRLMAGCAGMAEYLPEMLELARKPLPVVSFSQPGLVVISGSLNEMTLEQVEYARERGFSIIELTPEQKLCGDIDKSGHRGSLAEKIKTACKAGSRLILQAAAGQNNIMETDKLASSMGLSAEDTRARVAANMGRLIKILIDERVGGTFAIFGGDTLISAMEAIGGEGIVPVCEIESGVVLSAFAHKKDRMNLITKSGGFGNRDVIIRIEKFIDEHFNKEGEGNIYA